MCDKMAISAHILKIVENDPLLSLQMTAKEMFNRHFSHGALPKSQQDDYFSAVGTTE